MKVVERVQRWDEKIRVSGVGERGFEVRDGHDSWKAGAGGSDPGVHEVALDVLGVLRARVDVAREGVAVIRWIGSVVRTAAIRTVRCGSDRAEDDTNACGVGLSNHVLERSFNFHSVTTGAQAEIDLAEIDDNSLNARLVEHVAADAIDAGRTRG